MTTLLFKGHLRLRFPWTLEGFILKQNDQLRTASMSSIKFRSNPIWFPVVWLPYWISEWNKVFKGQWSTELREQIAKKCVLKAIILQRTEYMCYNQTGDISILDGTSLKLVDKFTYLGSSVSSTEKDIDTRLTKAWTAIDRLSIIWKSDLTDKMKRSFFQAAVVSILVCGCTTWTLTKRLKKKLDGNYTRMLWAILDMSWRQHPTRHQLYAQLLSVAKTIQVRRRTLLEKQGRTYQWCTPMEPRIWPSKSRTTSSNIYTAAYMRIRDIVLKTCQKRWMIGRSGERGSGISVLAARYDDGDDIEK